MGVASRLAVVALLLCGCKHESKTGETDLAVPGDDLGADDLGADLGAADLLAPPDGAVPVPSCVFSFASTAIPWAVPLAPGGLADPAMLGPANRLRVGTNVTWSLLDLDGDKKLDLVVGRVSGQATAGPWQVYLGQANGFSSSPTTWSVPSVGGIIDQTDSSVSRPSPSLVAWTTIDMDGDGKPDFVYRSTAGVLGAPATPHWDVYRNNGAGFDATAVSWPLPTCGAGGTLPACNQVPPFFGTSFFDLDGDHLPDLVFSNDGNASDPVFGFGTQPVWKVFRNTGTTFLATPIDYQVPGDAGPANGLANVGLTADYSWIGNQDVDGDGHADLVMMGSGNPAAQFGLPAAPVWRVYHGGANGFASPYATWSLPTIPGTIGLSQWPFYNMVDLNQDHRPEIMLTVGPDGTGATGPAVATESGHAFWSVYTNLGSTFETTAAHVVVPTIDTGTGVDVGLAVPLADAVYESPTYELKVSWFTNDLDGDGFVDLVLTGGFLNGTTVQEVYDASTAPHWNVYPGSCK